MYRGGSPNGLPLFFEAKSRSQEKSENNVSSYFVKYFNIIL